MLKAYSKTGSQEHQTNYEQDNRDKESNKPGCAEVVDHQEEKNYGL